MRTRRRLEGSSRRGLLARLREAMTNHCPEVGLEEARGPSPQTPLSGSYALKELRRSNSFAALAQQVPRSHVASFCSTPKVGLVGQPTYS